MKHNGWLFAGLVAGVLLTLGLLGSGAAQSLAAKADGARQLETTATMPPSDERSAAATPGAMAGSDEQPPAQGLQGVVAPAAFPTPIPGETLVYFVPSDSDATATVLFLYNTDSVNHTVEVRGYSYNGALGYSLNVAVAANSFVRLVSDSVAAAPPPSWATPAPVLTNFTDFTYVGSLSLPKGVKVEGYVVFNPGTGTVDPRLDQGGIPLRFSTDPDAIFLPAVLQTP